jgi:hypothetical protein
MDRTYGSAFHLAEYRRRFPVALDSAILTSARRLDGALHWLYPYGSREKEPQGLDCLELNHPARAHWKEFWPQSGRQQSWDGVARLDTPTAGSEWILIEAKANHPELTGAPSRAKEEGLKRIEASLGEVKQHLGVHRDYCWTASYYQYANRLALLYFLRRNGVNARCVFLYFTGDRFPDRRPCPASEDEWKPLLEARNLTLGLTAAHRLSDYVCSVFLPAATPDQKHEQVQLVAPKRLYEVVVNRDDFLSAIRVVAAAIKAPKSQRGGNRRQPMVAVSLEGDRLALRCGGNSSQTMARGTWSTPVAIAPRVLSRLLDLERPDEDEVTLSFGNERLRFGPYDLVAEMML